MAKMNEPIKTPVLEKIFERLLTASTQYKEFKNNLEELVKSVTNLAQSLVKLAHSVSQQRQDINELYESQQLVLNILKQRSSGPSSYQLLQKKPSDEELN